MIDTNGLTNLLYDTRYFTMKNGCMISNYPLNSFFLLKVQYVKGVDQYDKLRQKLIKDQIESF